MGGLWWNHNQYWCYLRLFDAWSLYKAITAVHTSVRKQQAISICILSMDMHVVYKWIINIYIYTKRFGKRMHYICLLFSLFFKQRHLEAKWSKHTLNVHWPYDSWRTPPQALQQSTLKSLEVEPGSFRQSVMMMMMMMNFDVIMINK